MKVYHVKTQSDYDALMIELEDKGCEWRSREKLTDIDEFSTYGKDTYVYDECCEISISSGEYFKEHYSNEPVIEYKAKGENMLNTECKQCHKKWHHDNAKYCTMCGKKLVDEPKFKSGDVVVSQVFSDGSSSLVRLNEDLTNHFTSVYGFWYTKRDCDISEVSFVVSKENIRHATPEEISEYEAALTFHENGREPFEVKKGDILKDDEGISFFIDFPSNLKRESFTSGRYTFLKTAEEFNEWLGVSDE